MSDWYMDHLTKKQQCAIIMTASRDEPYEKCPVQNEYAKQFYDSLLKEIAEHPGCVLQCPEIDDEFDDEDQKVMDAMFDGIDIHE